MLKRLNWYLFNLLHKTICAFVALTSGFFMAAMALRELFEQPSSVWPYLYQAATTPFIGVFHAASRVAEGLLGMDETTLVAKGKYHG